MILLARNLEKVVFISSGFPLLFLSTQFSLFLLKVEKFGQILNFACFRKVVDYCNLSFFLVISNKDMTLQEHFDRNFQFVVFYLSFFLRA